MPAPVWWAASVGGGWSVGGSPPVQLRFSRCQRLFATGGNDFLQIWTRSLATPFQTGHRSGDPNGTGPDPDEEDHYTLLGVPFTAGHAEITRAYRRAMKRAHPDRQRPEHRARSDDLARRLNAAYATLSDPIKRQAYDRTIRQQVVQDQIMQRYVGGFQSFDNRSGSPLHAQRPQPTAAERKERAAADRQASLTLVIYAAAVTAIILIALLVGSLLGLALGAVW